MYKSILLGFMLFFQLWGFNEILTAQNYPPNLLKLNKIA